MANFWVVHHANLCDLTFVWFGWSRNCWENMFFRISVQGARWSVLLSNDSKSHNCHAQPYCLCTTFEGCRSVYAHMKYGRPHDGGMCEIQISSSIWLLKPRNECYPTSRLGARSYVVMLSEFRRIVWFAGNRGSIELWFVVGVATLCSDAGKIARNLGPGC